MEEQKENAPISFEDKLLVEKFSKIKGRPPRAISKQLVETNKKRKQEKIEAIKKTKTGALQQTEKLDLFLEEFLRNGGNATQAALKVFNCNSIAAAGSMGSAYLKKARSLGRLYLEKKQYSYGRMLDVAVKKMEESKTPDWWDRLMKIADYEDFMTKKNSAPVAVNVFQAHKKFASDYVEGEIENAEIVEDGEEQ